MAAGERLRSWCDEVPGDAVRRALDLVGRFGLDRIYGEDIRPLIGPDQVLVGDAATRGARETPEP